MLSKAPHANCEVCPLREKAFAPSQFPTDSTHCRAAIVSRSPGRYDVAAGKPFSGPSGKLLDHILKLNGVERDSLYISNVVLCETDTLEGVDGEAATTACAPRLQFELDSIKTDTYITAGSEALRVLTDGKRTLRASRGQRIVNKKGQTLVATFNPAAALRDSVVYPDLLRDFKRAFTAKRDVVLPRVTVAVRPDEALSVIDTIERYEHGTIVAIDIESTGLSATDSLISIGFSPRDNRSFVIGREGLAHPEVHARVNSYFEGRQHRHVYHNGKFDVKLLRAAGYSEARVDEDTMLLSYSLDERAGVHSLDYLVQDVLDWELYEPAVVAEGKKFGFSEQPVIRTKQLKTKIKTEVLYEGFSAWDQLYEYNGYDTAGSRQLYGELSARVVAERTDSAYRKLLVPASNALADVEAYGVCFDVAEATRILHEEVMPDMAKLHLVCNELCGREINLNSHQQVSAFLYDECGITNPVFRRQKERSVDAIVRSEILRNSSEPAKVLRFLEFMDRYKKLDKLRGTYLLGLSERAGVDGRIRCDFLLHGTETGRLSSRNPNLQNIPRGGKDGLPNIRSLFVAPEGRCIVQADYSQAELRAIAMISGDQNLLNIYRQGKDLHTEVATELFGANFNKEQRVLAKNYNFGIVYGQEEFSFSQMYHISKAQARKDIDKWWARFPEVKAWTRKVHSEVQKNGQLYSVFGSKRRFPLLTSENLDHTLKEGVNFLIQNPASHFTLESTVRLMNDKELDLQRAFPIILVHDSIVLECEDEYAEEAGRIVSDTMADAPSRSLEWRDIPFDADVHSGRSWGEVA